MKALAIDLFCGLGGWAEGLLAEGWDVVGFDIKRHEYGEHRYPAQLVLQDVLTLHGSQFRNADLIVASPPCQFFSYCAMPWSRAKALAAEVEADITRLEAELALFKACFRLQREATAAAGRHIPLIVENVRGAQRWVGRARWNYGSFYLWGAVPALMPIVGARKLATGRSWSDFGKPDYVPFGFNQENERALKGVPHRTGGHWTNPGEHIKQGGSGAAWWDQALRREATAIKNGGGGADGWFGGNRDNPLRRGHSKSSSRKAAAALIAKIPLPLSRHIGRVFRPT